MLIIGLFTLESQPRMEYNTRLVWMVAVVLGTQTLAFGGPQVEVEAKKVPRICRKNILRGARVGSNNTRVLTGLLRPCRVGDPQVGVNVEKLPTTAKQEIFTSKRSGRLTHGINTTEPTAVHETLRVAHPPPPKKENDAGGSTGVNSDEVQEPSEDVVEDVEVNLDSLPPRPPYPEMDSVGVVIEDPATTEGTVKKEVPVNKQFPNEKKSELFIDSGIFPFIAMGVLSALFITMMIAALYFARNSADVQHTQLIGMKRGGVGPTMATPPGTRSFNTVTFRNSEDAVTGDFAVNMFAVRNEEREEAERTSTDVSESTLVATHTNTVPKGTTEPVPLETEITTCAVLHRDLPDVVSNPPSRCNTLSSNRHSTGSSLYMELMNLNRNTRILEELALRKKTIRIQDPAQLQLDCVLPDLSDNDTDSRRSGLQLSRQASLDSARCPDNVPLPCNYDRHCFKLYDADDDDSSAAWTFSTANTTMENILTSGDEGSSTLSSLHRKGSSKRNSRLLDESRLLLPVQEFFNESMIDSLDDDGNEVLYETIDEMGYRRRTASSRLMRSLMAAREEAGQAGTTLVVDNVWDISQKKYDRIDRRVKAYKKQAGKDYNSLIVKC